MTIYFSFMLTAIMLLFIVWLRSELVFRIRFRANTVVFDHNASILAEYLKNLDAKIELEEVKTKLLLYPSDRGPSYNAMVFDLTKWTFSQFYPDLAEL